MDTIPNQVSPAPKSTPKDVFLHLLAIVTLYMSAIAFIVLLFQLVNNWYPDPLSNSAGLVNSIRWSAAILIVSFPVYLFLMHLINKDITAQPSHRNLKVRKWLGYLTLFIAAITTIIDLATLVYYLLGGEFTIRFILKVIAVLVVAGVIFFYYLRELRSETSKNFKWLAWIVSGVVLAAIVGAFIVVGSPARQRKLDYDNRRVADLQNIQQEVVNYYQSKAALPADLTQLKDSISGYVPPADPETNAAYEYKVTGNLSFQLCATFDLQGSGTGNGNVPRSVPISPQDLYAQTWDHGSGLTCFDRSIDPQLYPVHPTPVQVK